jgi:regulatory protein
MGRRDYTETEIRDKLTERGYDSHTIDETIARLRDQRIVDDDRAARSHVRTATRVKNRGPLRVRRELAERGIADDVITRVLGEQTRDDDEAAITRVLARRRPAGPMTAVARQRLFRQLLQRGFPASLVSRALKTPVPDED